MVEKKKKKNQLNKTLVACGASLKNPPRVAHFVEDDAEVHSQCDVMYLEEIRHRLSFSLLIQIC